VRRTFGATVAVLLAVALACCSKSTGSPSPTPSSIGGPTSHSTNPIAIPTGELDAFARCMIGQGWQLIEVSTPIAPGFPTQYGFSAPSGVGPEILDRTRQCESLKPAVPTLSPAQIREVYDRWVGQYRCLVGLGYHPNLPPSFETFAATWATGPWSPIDGVDVDNWTQAQYDQAKSTCILDVYNDDRY
jgi:hypothetical protein